MVVRLVLQLRLISRVGDRRAPKCCESISFYPLFSAPRLLSLCKFLLVGHTLVRILIDFDLILARWVKHCLADMVMKCKKTGFACPFCKDISQCLD